MLSVVLTTPLVTTTLTTTELLYLPCHQAV